MSRKTIRTCEYSLSFGVDHTPMGCFFQLYETTAKGENPEADEYDTPQVEADELFGLKIHNPKTLDRNPKLREALGYRTLRNEEAIINIGKACGLDVAKDVYELWG